MDYSDYLKTNHWKEMRKKYFASKLPKICKICGTSKNLNLHHRSYKHLWHERIQIDFFVLCAKHHKEVHFSHPVHGKTPLNWKTLTTRTKTLRKQFRRNNVLIF